jgi:hypothetical protein
MQHARCRFEVVSFEAGPWPADVPGSGMKLGRATVRKRFAGGDLEGESVVEMLSARAGELAGTYVALEHVTGSLNGASGSFVLQHGATAFGDARTGTSWAEVVPGSGTGELASLDGRGSVAHGLLELDYELG